LKEFLWILAEEATRAAELRDGGRCQSSLNSEQALEAQRRRPALRIDVNVQEGNP
jgi:hypothetical protein